MRKGTREVLYIGHSGKVCVASPSKLKERQEAVADTEIIAQIQI